MFPAQGGSIQPSWQQGFNQGQRGTGPPPAKRSKSGPIITRYPPPPGYRGPGQPPAPHYGPGWQQPQPQPAYGQPVYPGYPPQPYGLTPPYQHPQYPGYIMSTGQPTPPSFPAQQSYHPPSNTTQPWQHLIPLPPQQGTTQSWHPQHSPYNSQSWQPPAATAQQGPVTQWHQQTSYGSHSRHPSNPAPHPGPLPHWQQPSSFDPQRRHNSAPFLAAAPHSTPSLTDDTDSLPPQLTSFSKEADELEGDYWDECYYGRHPDEIDEALSIGEVIYRPALPTRRPLPPTFDEAELEALAPRVPQLSDMESISDYHINSRSHEFLLDVRQTQMWQSVKQDPVFRAFSAVPENVLPLLQVIEMYSDRADPYWTENGKSPSLEPQHRRTMSAGSSDAESGAMDIEPPSPAEQQRPMDRSSEQEDVLGNLEEALGQQRNAVRPGRRSRTNSIASNTSQSNRPQPMGLIRDQSQENMLARLGVTGSPKMVYGLPPAALPRKNSTTSIPGSQQLDTTTVPATMRRSSKPNFSSQKALGGPPPPTHIRNISMNGDPRGRKVPPPPPPPPLSQHHSQSPFYETWNHDSHTSGTGHHRKGSNSSQRTATGSDFHPDEDGRAGLNGSNGDDAADATPRPSGRKRGRRESEDEAAELDEDTPRPLRKLPRNERVVG